jgi:hypothetical protein
MLAALEELHTHMPRAMQVIAAQAARGNRRAVALYRRYLQQGIAETVSESAADSPAEQEQPE